MTHDAPCEECRQDISSEDHHRCPWCGRDELCEGCLNNHDCECEHLEAEGFRLNCPNCGESIARRFT